MRSRTEVGTLPDANGRDPPLLAFLPALLKPDFSLPENSSGSSETSEPSRGRASGPAPMPRPRRTVVDYPFEK
jgi:hypothetical protein